MMNVFSLFLIDTKSIFTIPIKLIILIIKIINLIRIILMRHIKIVEEFSCIYIK